MTATATILKPQKQPASLPPPPDRPTRISGRRILRVRSHVEVAETAGPFDVIEDQEILVIADTQNLDAGAKELGFKMSWANLGSVLDDASKKAYRHAIIGRTPGDDRRWEYLVERGWQPHATEVRQVRTHRGFERKGNVDFLMAFLAGVLVSRTRAKIVVIASGDGDLVEEMAFGIRSLPRERRIVTLSLAGSTAFRLNAETSKLIDANIEIGQNCLRKMGR